MVVPSQATPVFHQTYPFVGHTPLSLTGPQVSEPAPSIADNASLIKEWADARKSRRNNPLPKCNFAQFKGDFLQWNEWYGQFKSAIDWPSLTENVKLTYLTTLAADKAIIAIVEFA